MQRSTSEEVESAERDRGAVTYPSSDDVIVERDVRVKMPDGVHLAATVCRPDRDGQFRGCRVRDS